MLVKQSPERQIILELAEDARAVDRVVDRTDVERASVRLRDVVTDAVAAADAGVSSPSGSTLAAR